MANSAFLEAKAKAGSALLSTVNLEEYFTAPQINGIKVETFTAGILNCSSGRIIACDPLVSLDDAQPFSQCIKPGSYEVRICTAKTAGLRYACAKLCISDKTPVRFEMALTGHEDPIDLAGLKNGEFFGFFVDSGMGCFADAKAQQAFKRYWEKREETEEDIDVYGDLFCELLEKSAQEHPELQRPHGDFALFTIPGTQENIIIFASGYGDGDYPCYFGISEDGEITGLYAHFIDLSEEDED